MNALRLPLPILVLTLAAGGCESVVEPDPGADRSPVHAMAPTTLQAAGTFTQTAITSLVPRAAGPNTILEQTSTGVVSGTMSGSWEDRLRVVIHPDGRFNAQFTITCACTVDGRSGTLVLRAQDSGRPAGPTTGAFRGTAVIVDGSGDLRGLRGSLRIEGTVDLLTGLATYDYAGTLRFTR